MRKAWLSMGVSVAVVALIVAALGGCPTRQAPKKVTDDFFNQIRKVEIDKDGKDLRFETSWIPQSAFSEETIDPEQKEDDKDEIPTDRVHPVLQDWIAADPFAVAEVIILLQDGVTIPRFPEYTTHVRRDSEDGKLLLSEADKKVRDLLAKRDSSTQAFLAAAAEVGVHLDVKEQFWLVNGFLTEMQLGAVGNLLDVQQMTYIQPQFAGEPPPQDGNANNDVDDGRARTVSDPYFNLGLTGGYMGLLDTGIRPTHNLFNTPSNVDYIRDCVNGGANCNDSTAAGWSPNDTVWNHGTSSAAILVANNRLGNERRGVTAITLDSWQIYTAGGQDTAAAVRAFQRGIAVLDRVFIGEIQASEGENGAIALAADNAYNAGAVVVAANGNAGPGARTVRSPGIAHKVLGIGSYHVETEAQYAGQGLGPAPDNRYKPDLQAPYRTETASNVNDTALKVFGGTSGATPYAAGAAALMRNWLRDHSTYDNGAVYAHMINSGTRAWPSYSNTEGVGKLRMPVNGVVWWGKVNVSDGSVINIPVNIGAGKSDMRASLWWPEAQTELHDDIDIHLLAPGGAEQARGYSGPSIFERARVTGALASGVWTIRIRGYNVRSGPQTVFWVVDVHS